MTTRRQAEYHARRARAVEYERVMHHPLSPGRNRDRQDSAHRSANMAYRAKLLEHGYGEGDDAS